MSSSLTNGPAGRRALVVGAGIAGLATALALHRTGWTVLVVERSAARRTGGYLVNLVGTGYDVASRFGIAEALQPRAIGAFATTMVRADGRARLTRSAETMSAVLGDRALTVLRVDLEAALYEQVRAHTAVRFGVTVDSVAEVPGAVDVRLTDGSTESVDLLIGADGVHSQVRRSVLGIDDAEVDCGHVVAAFTLPAPAAPSAADGVTSYIGIGRSAALFSLPTGESAAFFAYRAQDAGAEVGKGMAGALGERFGDLGGALSNAVAAVTEPETHDVTDTGFIGNGVINTGFFDTATQVVQDSWHRGRVVLIGDAAWCSTVFGGHGSSMAIDGADRLAAALDREADIEVALSEWEAQIRPIAERRQALARRGMGQFAPRHRWALAGQGAMLRIMSVPAINRAVGRALLRANG